MEFTNSVAVLSIVLLVKLRTNTLCEAASPVIKHVDLCGHEHEVILSENGTASSAIVVLSPAATITNGPCRLKIVAPITHAINMQFSVSDADVQRTSSSSTTIRPSAPCTLSVYTSENRKLPVWEGDPCGTAPLKIELLTPHIKIIWNPPAKDTAIVGRRIILTAVGEGEVCRRKNQFTCQRIGWIPKFCIAEELVCDGRRNCPTSGVKDDEDVALCKDTASDHTWKQLAMQIYEKLKPSDGLISSEWLKTHLNINDNSTNSTPKSLLDFKRNDGKNTNANEKITVDNISAALAHYGPWGYLMLGMLICGTVLMFCGLWECCCNTHKTTSEPSAPSPATTVFIINPQQQQQQPEQDDAANNGPPNYEDLDQPPAYTTLFPNYKSCGSRTTLAANFVTPDGQIIASNGGNYCVSSNSSLMSGGATRSTIFDVDIGHANGQ